MMHKDQNACLMVTTVDEGTGKHLVTYIPIFVYDKIVEFFLEHGACKNNHAISFELESTGKKFWKEMWKELEANCIFEEE